MNRKDFWRPIYGTVVFQPFALLWCWLSGDDYLTMMDHSFYSPPSFSCLFTQYTKNFGIAMRKHR